jgi:hypothetical protein
VVIKIRYAFEIYCSLVFINEKANLTNFKLFLFEAFRNKTYLNKDDIEKLIEYIVYKDKLTSKEIERLVEKVTVFFKSCFK